MRPDGLKKLYYSIREVSDLTDVEAHVLRFWEKEFSVLRPKRGRSGNRAYKERDVKIVLAIKDLLYEQKYTIQGAAEQLRNDRSLWENQPLEEHDQADANGLMELREMLVELRALVNGTSEPTDGTQ